MIGKDAEGFNIDSLAIIYTDDWITVLAAPHIYRALQRPVDPAFLIHLLDIWIAYVDRGDHYMPGTPEPDRPFLARKLRELLATWTPPDLPAEITSVARAVLRAEGYKKPPMGAATWDDFNFDPDSPIESHLAWPETEIMLKEATAADVEASNAARKIAYAKWLKEMEDKKSEHPSPSVSLPSVRK